MARPPSTADVSWRPQTLDDVTGLAAHTLLIHRQEHLSFLPGEDFFGWLLTQEGIDLESDTLVGTRDDVIVADCGTWLHHGGSGARCIVWAETTPGYEHLKPEMLRWAVERARERLAGTDPNLPRVIRTSVEEHRTAHRVALEAAGLTDVRVFAEMARSLDGLPPASPLPPGITVVPWSPDHTESARLASNEAFGDHWGSLPMSTKEFTGMVSESPMFRPDLSFLALDGDEVVAFCFCEVDEEDNADRDTNDVYINRVGTRRAHRGKQLASHLIVRSLEAAAATGVLDRAALEVDEMSHTDATAVYERLGFETYARSVGLYTEI